MKINNNFKKIFLLLVLSLTSISFGQGNNKHKENTKKILTERVKTLDGLYLHLEKDVLEKSKIKAVLVISHGLASHSGIFEGPFSKKMNENGIVVYRFDHRGHGKSDGRDKIHIKSYFEMADDLDIIKKAKKENAGKPIFVLGHSMGGHIAALSGTRTPKQVNGYILAAGVLRYHRMNFGYLPRPEKENTFINSTEAAHNTLNLPIPDHGGSDLSVQGDPLILTNISVSFANSFKEGIKYLKDKDDEFIDPVLLVSGDADLYVVPQDAIDFYNETNSVDKSLRLYNNIGHMLFLKKVEISY